MITSSSSIDYIIISGGEALSSEDIHDIVDAVQDINFGGVLKLKQTEG